MAGALAISHLVKSYAAPCGPLTVIAGVTLALDPGDAIAIVGPSGCGKTSLLSAIAALEPPTSGTVTIDGRNPFVAGAADLAAFRNRDVGCVFHDDGLLPQLTALENVLVPTWVGGGTRDDDIARARMLLELAGVNGREDRRPASLSIDERQRVAIARAFMRHPSVVVCDEPTARLTGASAAILMSTILELHRRHQNVLVVGTDNAEVAAIVPRRFRLEAGRLREIRDSGLAAEVARNEP